jgi:hypothetical protein
MPSTVKLLAVVVGLLAGSGQAGAWHLEDSLRGSTLGNAIGGSFGPEGWTVTDRADRIWYALPRLEQGFVEFTLSNVTPANIGDVDNELFAMYEAGYGIAEPIPYSPEFRNNNYKCMLRVFGNLEAGRERTQKLMWGLCPDGAPGYNNGCLCPSAFFEEPFGGTGDWDGTPQRIRIEWGQGVTRYLRNGAEVLAIDWSQSGLSFGPAELHISLGTSRPTATDAQMPVGAVLADLVVDGVEGELEICPGGDTTPAIVTAALPPAQLGTPYSAFLQARDGDPPLAWSLVSGQLPPGLSLAAAEIAGTPTAVGQFGFRVQVSDAQGDADERDLSLEVTSSAGQEIRLGPEADLHTDAREPDTNFGAAPELALGGGAALRTIVLRFDLQGLPPGARVVDARLIVHVVNGGYGGALRHFLPADPAWDELAPTHDQPLAGADASGDLASLARVDVGGVYEYGGLAPAVTGNGRVTFVIRSDQEDGAAFPSRDNPDPAVRPVLRVEYVLDEPADGGEDGAEDAGEDGFDAADAEAEDAHADDGPDGVADGGPDEGGDDGSAGTDGDRVEGGAACDCGAASAGALGLPLALGLLAWRLRRRP